MFLFYVFLCFFLCFFFIFLASRLTHALPSHQDVQSVPSWYPEWAIKCPYWHIPSMIIDSYGILPNMQLFATYLDELRMDPLVPNASMLVSHHP